MTKSEIQTEVCRDGNLDNPDESYTWSTIDLDFGADCQPTAAFYIDHFAYNNPPAEDYLYTPLISLENIQDAALTFDYAYVRYGNGYEDGFRVEVSSDCGADWDTLFDACCQELMTVDLDQGDYWVPACGDWQPMTFDLSNYQNLHLMVRFVGVNGWGNNFFLDNVGVAGTNVTGIATTSAMEHTVIFPNPAKNEVHIRTSKDLEGIEIIDLAGKIVLVDPALGRGQHELNIGTLSSGIYFIKLKTASDESVEKLIVD